MNRQEFLLRFLEKQVQLYAENESDGSHDTRYAQGFNDGMRYVTEEVRRILEATDALQEER